MSTKIYSCGCVGGDIYRFLPASALQPEGPCGIFEKVEVLVFFFVGVKGENTGHIKGDFLHADEMRAEYTAFVG